ncbi:hypothetical protein ACUY22_11790 [Corynebacterium tuberculostearicum]|uniref:hypothetical protein n=1 Tax=Corynebacterium diphtheriae TaxID=1717 RepID=UPI000615079D|nr:hypothetical protein [Corynebacterium diphtheriae]KKA80430.1 hypothetical protein VN94_11290 [Corynebacterium diphtheriae]
MPQGRYIDDPRFRRDLEDILERLEAQEVTSPLELGSSILQTYSQARYNYTFPTVPAASAQDSNLRDSYTWSRLLDSTAAYPGWDKDELEHLAQSATPLDADSLKAKGLASHRYRVSAKSPDTRQQLLETMLEQLDDSNLIDVHLTHTVGTYLTAENTKTRFRILPQDENTGPSYRLTINTTEPLERNLSTATRAVFTANAYTLQGDTLNECARTGLFGNEETNPDAFYDRRKTTAEFFTHSATRVFTGLFKDQPAEHDDITIPDFLNREELDAIATRLHVCAHQWIDIIQPETTTPYGPEEHNSLDTVLSRFPNHKTRLAPGAQASLDFIESLGLDETPTGYQTGDNAHDNQIDNAAPELEEQHEDDQDAEL